MNRKAKRTAVYMRDLDVSVLDGPLHRRSEPVLHTIGHLEAAFNRSVWPDAVGQVFGGTLIKSHCAPTRRDREVVCSRASLFALARLRD